MGSVYTTEKVEKVGRDQLKESSTIPIKKNTGVWPGHPKKTPIL